MVGVNRSRPQSGQLYVASRPDEARTASLMVLKAEVIAAASAMHDTMLAPASKHASRVVASLTAVAEDTSTNVDLFRARRCLRNVIPAEKMRELVQGRRHTAALT